MKIVELNSEDFVIEEDEIVVKFENMASSVEALAEKFEVEIEEVDDGQYLLKKKDLAKIKGSFKEKKKIQKKVEKLFEENMSPLQRILAKIHPTKEEIEAAGFKVQDVNDTSETTYEERMKFVRSVLKMETERYEALSPEDRAIIDKPVMPSFDMGAPDYKGITDDGMRALYDEAWNRVSKEEEIFRYRQPDLVLHEWGLNHLPDSALAAYNPAAHNVTVGKILWENYGNVELIEKERQEIIDVFVHEFSHIVNLNHGTSFWELTGRNDSVGAKIREYHKQRAEEAIAKSKARRNK